ncbi:MAG TPA: response regulator transcription factor [Trueperaceae bacterium]|nr:response regulator transcription factor [Trueperaceae bacterium]
MHLLIVEDDPAVASSLDEALVGLGFDTRLADSAQAGWEALWSGPVDVIVLDVMLPEGPDAGFEWAAAVRDADFRQPILFLTAREALADRLRGLEHGDDYLMKPFALSELIARVNALARRGELRAQIGRWRDVVFDVSARHVELAGASVRLTAKELEVLELFMLNPRRMFRREEVLDRVWGAGFETPSNLVDVYVKNLRRKLGDDIIETERGLGYRFPGEEPEPS